MIRFTNSSIWWSPVCWSPPPSLYGLSLNIIGKKSLTQSHRFSSMLYEKSVVLPIGLHQFRSSFCVVHFFQHHLLKKLFSTAFPLHLCMFCYVGLCVSFCQNHIVLGTTAYSKLRIRIVSVLQNCSPFLKLFCLL